MRFKIGISSGKKTFATIRKFIPGIDEQISLEHIENPSRLLTTHDRLFTPDLLVYEVNDSPAKAVDLVSELLERKQISVIIITSRPDWKTAREFAKLGITNYFLLPDDIHQLIDTVEFMMNEWNSRQQAADMLGFQKEFYDFSKVIGHSESVAKTVEKAKTASKEDNLPALICGQIGTGKEYIARVIHYNSSRCEEPFVDVTCSGIPEKTLESELFGYERGALRDVRESRRGLLEITGSGTIFLDEVGSLSPYMQAKLLKTIRRRSFRRIGGAKEIPADVRIIAGSAIDLEAKVSAGKFNSGLYYQLNVMRIDLAPLEQRKEDLPLLVEDFIQSFNEIYGKAVTGLAEPAKEILMQHEWKGHVRELRHAIERAVILAKETVLQPHDFQFLYDRTFAESIEEKVEGEREEGVNIITLHIPIERGSLEEVEKQFVEEVLKITDWNKSKAAGVLKISRPRLDRIINRYQMMGS
jgi:DNA-binding NtrC family response regulator